jgi:hypothetical protein
MYRVTTWFGIVNDFLTCYSPAGTVANGNNLTVTLCLM